MIKFKLSKKEDINKIASFIAKFNSKEESHIGYCGINKDEIANSLVEDITDIPFNESFIIATEDKWYIATGMWNKMMEILPEEIDFISMFINKENENCLRLADSLHFTKESEEIILRFERSYIDKLQDISIVELLPDYYRDIRLLHDKAFPNTYYNGNQILGMLNDHRKVFIDVKENKLIGYIYVEVNPIFGEGSIEFFAVDESQRGKGIGGKLLTMALKWLFTFDSVDDITLCVNSTNEKALNLYKMVGFKQEYQLCYFAKNVKE